MKNKTILTTLVCGLFAANLHAVEVANPATDYALAPDYVAGTTAPTAPPAGWEYLASDALTGGTEVALTPQTATGNGGNSGFSGTENVNVLGDQNAGAQYEIFSDGFDGNPPNIPIGNEGIVGTDLLLHPGNDATAFVIVRYTISEADLVNGTEASITGSFRDLAGRPDRSGPAESITANVFLNSTSLSVVTGGTTAQNTPAYLEQAAGTFNLAATVAEGDVISFVVGNNGVNSGDETALRASIDLGMVAPNVPPTVALDPVSQDIPTGDPLNLSVTASGTETLRYQWRRNAENIPGEEDPNFTIASVALDDEATYDCVVTNSFRL